MTRINRIAAAIFAAGLLGAAPVLAQNAFPRTVGSGENITVEYGPAGSSNVVGGGATVLRNRANGEVDANYLEPDFAQTPRQGVVAVEIGSGESAETIWVPAASATANAGRAGARG